MTLKIIEIGYEIKGGGYYVSSSNLCRISLNIYSEGILTKEIYQDIVNFGLHIDSTFNSYTSFGYTKYKLSIDKVVNNPPSIYVNNLIDIISENGKIIVGMGSEDLFLSKFCKLFINSFETVDKSNLLYHPL